MSRRRKQKGQASPQKQKICANLSTSHPINFRKECLTSFCRILNLSCSLWSSTVKPSDSSHGNKNFIKHLDIFSVALSYSLNWKGQSYISACCRLNCLPLRTRVPSPVRRIRHVVLSCSSGQWVSLLPGFSGKTINLSSREDVVLLFPNHHHHFLKFSSLQSKVKSKDWPS